MPCHFNLNDSKNFSYYKIHLCLPPTLGHRFFPTRSHTNDFGTAQSRSDKTRCDVTTVFWACLIASSNLQMCIPQFIVLTKGKFAIASFTEPSSPSPSLSPSLSFLPIFPRKIHPFRKIIPSIYSGELAFNNLSFPYPSRPALTVPEDVSLFLPANERRSLLDRLVLANPPSPNI